MKINYMNSDSFDKIKVFVLDFDGVLTNNLVQLDSDGKEFVSCSRSDGLAFDVLKKLNKTVYILSSETNPVVQARANKLKVPVIQGVMDKVDSVKLIATKNKCKLSEIIYIGNDLNDYNPIQLCGYSACPQDSHSKIKEIVDIVLQTNGGKGVLRELLEERFNLDFVDILFSDKESY